MALKPVELETSEKTLLRVLEESYPKGGREPLADDFEGLVEEVALGYYTVAELADRFGVRHAGMVEVLEHPGFRAAVLARRKELDAAGTSARLVARRKVREGLPMLVEVMDDQENVGGRLRAFEQLRAVAEIGGSSGGAVGAGVVLQINTNLGVGDAAPDGRYVLKAKRDEEL